MMLTHRLSALAHDLAKQCHVANTSKPEEKVRGKKPAEETIQSSSKYWVMLCVYG